MKTKVFDNDTPDFSTLLKESENAYKADLTKKVKELTGNVLRPIDRVLSNDAMTDDETVEFLEGLVLLLNLPTSAILYLASQGDLIRNAVQQQHPLALVDAATVQDRPQAVGANTSPSQSAVSAPSTNAENAITEEQDRGLVTIAKDVLGDQYEIPRINNRTNIKKLVEDIKNRPTVVKTPANDATSAAAIDVLKASFLRDFNTFAQNANFNKKGEVGSVWGLNGDSRERLNKTLPNFPDFRKKVNKLASVTHQDDLVLPETDTVPIEHV